MALHDLRPNQLLASTNLTPTSVTPVQDDPHAPDASWLTTPALENMSCRLGFPVPAGRPMDFQAVYALLRKSATGGNEPNATVTAAINGTTVASANVVISNPTGQIVPLYFDTPKNWNGSGLELSVVGTRSGGATTVRRTIHVGAAKWRGVHLGADGYASWRAWFYQNGQVLRFNSRDHRFSDWPMTGAQIFLVCDVNWAAPGERYKMIYMGTDTYHFIPSLGYFNNTDHTPAELRAAFGSEVVIWEGSVMPDPEWFALVDEAMSVMDC